MSHYYALGLPEAWKPLLRVLADEGWELQGILDASTLPDCRHVLSYGEPAFYLSFWDEPEWCGNSLQSNGLTVATLTLEPPADLHAAEEHALLLTGDWEKDAYEFVASFLKARYSKSSPKSLSSNDLRW